MAKIDPLPIIRSLHLLRPPMAYALLPILPPKFLAEVFFYHPSYNSIEKKTSKHLGDKNLIVGYVL